MMSEAELKQGVLDGSIASAAWDTACTSNAGMIGDPYLQTSEPSTKVFAVADGHRTPGANIAKLHHPVREPARTVDMVPALADQSLLSGVKFAEAGYISICDGDEVNIYDGRTARIMISEEAVLRGWRCPRTRLWRIPLQAHVTNLNTHTLLLDGPTGTESLNSLYSVPSTAKMLNHIEAFASQPAETINNVYELPSIEPTIRYLHAAAGYPTKATWLEYIRQGNYITWPLVNVKNVNKYFPESEETQKGHMRNQRQGVRSTKAKAPAEAGTLPGTAEAGSKAGAVPIDKLNDVYIAVYSPRETIFTDQTGKFPFTSSRGNNYQMVVHDIDSNSTWVEPMKNRTEGEMILA